MVTCVPGADIVNDVVPFADCNVAIDFVDAVLGDDTHTAGDVGEVAEAAGGVEVFISTAGPENRFLENQESTASKKRVNN